MGIAVAIRRPHRPGGGISGGRRAIMVNTRERESVVPQRPPDPIRSGDTPSRPPRMPVFFSLNPEENWEGSPEHFRLSSQRFPGSPYGGEPPLFGGWEPWSPQTPMARTPPREFTEQLLDQIPYDDYYDYAPEIPRP